VAVPLYGWVQGDSVVVVVLAREDQTIRELVELLCQAVAVRVSVATPGFASLRGKRLDPDTSVRAAGIEPLDRIDVLFSE
jgi:hypothetical protein